MFTISLFGNSIRVFESIISIEEFIKIKELSNHFGMDINTCFLDLDFVNKIGFENWSEIGDVQEHNLFQITTQNYIEIKKGNKRILKIKSNELENEVLLFPKFNINQSTKYFENQDIEKQKILISQYETGCFGKYKINTSEFNLGSLLFDLNQFNFFEKSNCIASISYDEEILYSFFDDTLIKSIRVFII
jgi:hypothetical protein